MNYLGDAISGPPGSTVKQLTSTSPNVPVGTHGHRIRSVRVAMNSVTFLNWILVGADLASECSPPPEPAASWGRGGHSCQFGFFLPEQTQTIEHHHDGASLVPQDPQPKRQVEKCRNNEYTDHSESENHVLANSFSC